MKTNDSDIKDRDLVSENFELEQHILRCWNLVDDIQELCDDFEKGDIDQSSLVSALRSYADTYQIRFDRTFRKYETVCRGLHELRTQLKEFGAKTPNRSKVVDQ